MKTKEKPNSLKKEAFVVQSRHMQHHFAIIGVGGYIAPRHLKAIKENEGELLAATDPKDSVGILDSYFPQADFFTEFERFDRHIEKLRRKNSKKIDYVSICSPNYLHDAHIRFALRIGANAICEKPLVLNPWNVDALQELEKEFGGKVNTILQLRVHPALQQIQQEMKESSKKHEVDLTYITSRGHWYLSSWKGEIEKSGGLATNIGIHFFDMLMWMFGNVQKLEIHKSSPTTVSGYLELERARVRWFLSINNSYLPKVALQQKKTTFRSITIDGKEIEFSEGFTDLHTVVYKQTLAGKGFGLADAKPAIELAHRIRTQEITENSPLAHPFVKSQS